MTDDELPDFGVTCCHHVANGDQAHIVGWYGDLWIVTCGREDISQIEHWSRDELTAVHLHHLPEGSRYEELNRLLPINKAFHLSEELVPESICDFVDPHYNPKDDQVVGISLKDSPQDIVGALKRDHVLTVQDLDGQIFEGEIVEGVVMSPFFPERKFATKRLLGPSKLLELPLVEWEKYLLSKSTPPWILICRGAPYYEVADKFQFIELINRVSGKAKD